MGNTNDRPPVMELVRPVFGKLYADICDIACIARDLPKADGYSDDSALYQAHPLLCEHKHRGGNLLG
ncbi:hypothetical protein F4X88_17260 [Candidatus Poribacteria bacterium]|nr:hypothetical protein [Candidatus Poribacteria bacterium]MXV84636.1 hypothetical protein [Candidatus Poribacteria bacterium]MYA58033.1 hypothetical protein [Candidatus Poribacteria bacterium]